MVVFYWKKYSAMNRRFLIPVFLFWIMITPEGLLANMPATLDTDSINSPEWSDSLLVSGKQTVLIGPDFTLGSQEVGRQAGMDFTSGLEGLVPGFDISSVGAEPGAYVRMLIRGSRSINAGSDPLIIIDGVPFENATLDVGGYRFSGLGELEADDIESIQIMKGAASVSKYGARGANGVVSITTKQGANTGKRLQFSYHQGVSTSPKKLDLLDADQFINVLNRAYQNSNPGTTNRAPVNLHTYDGFYAEPYTDSDGITHQPNLSATNWYEDMHMPGSSHYIRGTFQGSEQGTRYFVGATARRDESFLYGGKYDRGNIRLNINNQVTNRLNIGVNLYLAANRRDVKSKSWFETAQTTALPVYPVNNPVRPAFFWYNQSQPVNIAALNQHSWDLTEGMRTFNTAFAQYDLPLGFSIGSRWSYDYQYYRREDYRHPYVAPAENGLLIIGRIDRSNWTGDQFISFERRSGAHQINATAGFSLENYVWDRNNIYNPGMTLLFVHSNGESNQRRLAWTDVGHNRFYSAYANVSYLHNDRYHILLNIRSDASSRFGKNNRSHFFPGGRLAWDIGREDFLQDVPVISHLQLFTEYGISGNAMIGSLLHKSSLGQGERNFNGYYRYGTYPAVVPVNMGNSYLGPERSARFDAGLGFGLLENRISGEIQYFNIRNYDLLLPMPVSMLYGYENPYRWENGGELLTSGLELFLSAGLLRASNRFSWQLDLSFTSLATELTSLPAVLPYLEGYFNRATPGNPPGGYFIAEWAGVDPATGHELIRDPVTGQTIDAETLSEEAFRAAATYFPDKTPYPKWYGGIRNKFSYRGLELSVLFTSRQGHYLLDMGEQSMSYVGSGSTGLAGLVDGWSSASPTNTPLLYDTKMSERMTSRFLHDASYVRLQELSLSYSLPETLFGIDHGQNIGIFLTGRNLMTWTGFPGYDPNGLHSAYSSMSGLDAGLLMFDPPAPRMFIIGFTMGF